MVNKPKSQTLKDRIEKTTLTDIDQDWQTHCLEAMNSFNSIEQMPAFNLLDPQNAKSAADICSAQLKKLQQVKKQVTAVNSLLKQKRDEALVEVNKLPWPTLEDDGSNQD